MSDNLERLTELYDDESNYGYGYGGDDHAFQSLVHKKLVAGEPIMYLVKELEKRGALTADQLRTLEDLGSDEEI
jgi:hypothetical protein